MGETWERSKEYCSLGNGSIEYTSISTFSLKSYYHNKKLTVQPPCLSAVTRIYLIFNA